MYLFLGQVTQFNCQGKFCTCERKHLHQAVTKNAIRVPKEGAVTWHIGKISFKKDAIWDCNVSQVSAWFGVVWVSYYSSLICHLRLHFLSLFSCIRSKKERKKKKNTKNTSSESLQLLGEPKQCWLLKAVNCSLQKRNPLSLQVHLLEWLILPGRD